MAESIAHVNQSFAPNMDVPKIFLFGSKLLMVLSLRVNGFVVYHLLDVASMNFQPRSVWAESEQIQIRVGFDANWPRNGITTFQLTILRARHNDLYILVSGEQNQ